MKGVYCILEQIEELGAVTAMNHPYCKIAKKNLKKHKNTQKHNLPLICCKELNMKVN